MSRIIIASNGSRFPRVPKLPHPVLIILPVAIPARRAEAGAATGSRTSIISRFQPQLSGRDHCSVYRRLHQRAGGRQHPSGRDHRPLVESGFHFWSELLTFCPQKIDGSRAPCLTENERPQTHDRSSVPSDLARPDGAVTPVLLASSRSDDLERIPALLPRREWMVIKVKSWSHVLQVLSAVILPIVLCDREIPGLEWPHGLAQLNSSFRALKLRSDLAASTRWQDMIRYGGFFDMLLRPLCQDRLLTALDMARIQWEMRLDYAVQTVPPSRP